MPLRNILVKEAIKLSLEDNSILVTRKEGKDDLRFPLEDIGLIFVEDPNTVISCRLMTKLSESKTSMILCGENYLPVSQVLPFNGHYLQSSILDLQMSLLPYKKKKLWEAIVKQKIKNQMGVISVTNADDDCSDKLKTYLSNVTPGDETNMEGVSARAYFESLFGKSFIRFSSSPLSIALNYGYSIIAGSVIRSVAFSGLYDNLGIWHCSDKNNNNLSYDLIEPYRQVVDRFVFNHRSEICLPLSHEIKLGLISLLDSIVIIDKRKLKVSFAIQKTVDSYVDCLRNKTIEGLQLPELNLSMDESDGEGIV